MVGDVVYVAITSIDYEGEIFHGVFATAASAKKAPGFGPSKAKWRYSPKAKGWARNLRSGVVEEVRRVLIQPA